MRLTRGICIAIFAAGVLSAGGVRPGAAQTSVNAVFENYHLFGVFAVDCSKPASEDNYYYVNRLIDPGHVQRDRMIGTDVRDYVAMIDQAAAVGPSEISISGTRVEGRFKGQSITERWRVEADRQMTSEATIGGTATITGGRLFDGGQVGWANRCGATPAAMPSGVAAPPSTGTASAGCHTDNYAFSTLLSQPATANSVSTGGASCSYTLSPIHPDQVQFTGASIVKQPSNGTFEQTGAFAFKYQPNSGFKGTDEYAIKVCGHSSERAGCATITYHVAVK